MLVQIGNCSYDKLSNKELDWLSSADPDQFVGIIEGDESEPRRIDMDAVSADQILAGKVSGSIVIDNDHVRYADLVAAARSIQPAYWAGETRIEIDG